MPSRKKIVQEHRIPPPVVEKVLELVRADMAAKEARSEPSRGSRESSGSIFLSEHPAKLREGEVLVLLIDSNMTVARTVQVSPAPKRSERELSNLLDVAAMRLAEIEVVRRDVLTSALPRPDVSALSVNEEALLRRGGFDSSADSASETGPIAQAKAEYASILADSITVEEAAKVLGVNESRIRQRLGNRTLYGIKTGGTWRIPRFQFDRRRIVPGLEAVLPAISPDTHPVAVRRWLTTANADLVLGADEHAASPLDWLASGGDPASVVDLARAL